MFSLRAWCCANIYGKRVDCMPGCGVCFFSEFGPFFLVGFHPAVFRSWVFFSLFVG